MQTFTDFAKENGLKMAATTIPTRTCGQWSEGAFHWHVVITNQAGAVLYSGEYSAGSGWAEIWARESCPTTTNGTAKKDITALRAWRAMRKKPQFNRGMTTHDKEQLDIVQERFAAKGPELADVLESLRMDMESAEEDFEDWADAYGYDHDSRSAEDTWRRCREIRRAFRKAAGAGPFRAFMEIEPQ